MRKVNNFVREYINNNLKIIIILVLLFLVGTIIGILYANSLDEQVKNDLMKYVKDINSSVINENYKISNIDITISCVKNILIYFGIIYILGCTVILSSLIYPIYIYKGFSIGFCTSILIMLLGNVKGSIYAIISLFIPCIIFIICMIFLSILWLKFGKYIWDNRSLYNYKMKISSNTAITVVATIITAMILLPVQLILNNIIYYFIKII